MLNTAQFSAAKDLSETKALQSLAIESKSFKEFKDEANKIVNVINNQWLRVEQDLCKRNAIQGEVWRNMEKDKDLYPYWEYKTEEDDRVRDEHAALEGLIFKIGDPEGDSVHPENGWNCFTPETLILTSQGNKTIDSLNIGDIVFGGSGNKQRIEAIHINKFDGELVEIITKRGHVLCTDNHRVLTIKGWTSSKYINSSDIIINIRKLHGFNSVISYIHNCYAFSCYIIMSLIVKRYTTCMEALNTYITFWQKNINKIWRNTIISNTFYISSMEMLENNIFILCKCPFGNVLTGRIEMPGFVTMQNSFIHNVRVKKRSSKFKFIRNNFNGFFSFFGKSKIGVRYFCNITTHFATLCVFPLICIYPLALYCITSMTNWYIKVIEQSRNNPIIAKFPAFTKFSERIKLNRIKFIQHNGSGAPLDVFNSRNVMLYSFFFHYDFNLVTRTNIQKYNGNISNLDINKDESYITDIGIVHNCRCHSEPVDDMYLKEENKEISKGADYLNEKDPETGNAYIDKNFRYNPGIQGPLPNDSSYSEVLESANKLKPEMFMELPISKEPITGLTIDQAKEVMDTLELSPVDKQALKDYTGEKFNQINQFLGGVRKEIPETIKNTMNELNSFLKSAPKVSDTTYRGKKGDRVFNEFKNLKKGDIYCEKAFMSTTYDKSMADKFADGNYNKVVMTIKGKSGVLIEKYSDVRTEKEVLFNKGSKYKIESIKTEKKGFYGKISVSLIEI